MLFWADFFGPIELPCLDDKTKQIWKYDYKAIAATFVIVAAVAATAAIMAGIVVAAVATFVLLLMF